jgi:hypothetical protein
MAGEPPSSAPSITASFRSCRSRLSVQAAEAAAYAVEVAVYFVIPSEARNLSWVRAGEKKERFLASLGMTKGWGTDKTVGGRTKGQRK